jgi:hypothetical protein
MTAITTDASTTAVAQLDLMPYLRAVIAGRWILLAAFVLGAAAAGWLAWQSPYMYSAGAKVSVVDIEDPGGVSPDDRRASEVLTLVEHGFVMGTTRDNYNAVMLARLRSRNFTMHFLDTHNIYRFFYPEQWSEERGAWIDGFRPDRGEVFTRFRDEVRAISIDEETDIITVAMRWPEPSLPMELANLYVREFNEHMRERTREEVRRKQAFLEEKLRQSDLVDIQQSIYRLIEAQTAIMMLANAREEYVLEIIDPAARPYRSVTMSRKKKTAVGGIVGLLLATFAVLGIAFLRELWTTLSAHLRNQCSTAPEAQP